MAPSGACEFPGFDGIKMIAYDSQHCVVACDDASDCPADQSCRLIPGTPMQICYPGADDGEEPNGTDPGEHEPGTVPGTDPGAENGEDTPPEPKCTLNSGWPCACNERRCEDGSPCLFGLFGPNARAGLCAATVNPASGECPDYSAPAYSDDVLHVGGVSLCALVCQRDDECPADQKCRPLPDQSGWNICHP
jgi:hypothetical protein